MITKRQPTTVQATIVQVKLTHAAHLLAEVCALIDTHGLSEEFDEYPEALPCLDEVAAALRAVVYRTGARL